jgi:hypothetical protein
MDMGGPFPVEKTARNGHGQQQRRNSDFCLIQCHAFRLKIRDNINRKPAVPQLVEIYTTAPLFSQGNGEDSDAIYHGNLADPFNLPGGTPAKKTTITSNTTTA